MTVINMISFGNEGVAVADEQSSGRGRKYNVAQKLRFLDGSYVYGGSGGSDHIMEVYDLISSKIEKLKEKNPNLSLEEVYQIAQSALVKHRKNLKDKVLLMNVGIDLKDFLSGAFGKDRRRLDDGPKNYAGSLVNKIDNEYSMTFLLGGVDNGKFDIYYVSSGHAGSKVSRPYCSIGSGSDESDKVLSGYVANLPRASRDSIDRQEGLVKIIEATNASSNLNVGVGGSPSIAFMSADGKIVTPGENQCILASELVDGLTNDLLPRDFVYNAVSNLVYANGDSEKIEEEMKTKSTDWKKLDRILRGYKE